MGNVIHLLLVLAGAFAAWSIWLAEVCWVKGWAGLAWLSGFNWSVLPICALIVTIASYVVCGDASRSRRLTFIGVGCAITIAASVVARWAAFELFSGGVPGRRSLGAAIVLLLADLSVAAGLTISANRWLAPLHSWTGILVAAGLLLVLPLSIVTVKAFPALNGSTDEIHAIKMGYPIFWTAVLVPAALRLGRKRGLEPG